MKPSVIKTQEHSSSINDETKQEDIITKLPEALLTHIISLLPDADACRTSILSKRWRDLWMFLPNLHLVMPICRTKEEFEKFYDLVDKTLAIRDGMSIQKFLLSCSPNCDYDRVHHWLCIVVQCKVEILGLQLPKRNRQYDIPRVNFCWDLFKTCNSLVELTLKGAFVLDLPKADVVLFPRLRKISLIRITCLSWESLKNLILGCPDFEELSVKHYAPTYYTFNLIKLGGSSLKRLKICSPKTSKSDKVVIHEYSYMQNYCIFPTHILAKPLSYVEVYNSKSYQFATVAILFSYIAKAKILTMTNSSLEALVLKGLNKYTLSNVEKLMIDNISTWNSLLVLLHSVPNLEHITFSDGISHDKLSWIPPTKPPACLHLKMKEIIILNRKTVNHEEFRFVMFLLEYSKNLEKLRINAHGLDPMRHEQLQKFHLGLCRIEIV